MSSLAKVCLVTGALLGVFALAACGGENSNWTAPGVPYGTMIKFPVPWDSINSGTNQNLTLKLSNPVTEKAYIDISWPNEADKDLVTTSWQSNKADYVIIAANSDTTDVNIAVKTVTASRQVTIKFILRNTTEKEDFRFVVKP
jgi:hypothetical protein